MAEFEDLRGNSDRVIEMYRTYLARTDLDLQQRGIAENNLAYMLALRGKEREAKEARSLIQSSIKRMGPTADLLDTQACVNIALGDYESAVADMENAVAAGETAVKLFHLSRAQFLDRNRTAAAEALRRAEELGLNVLELSDAEQKIYEQLRDELELEL
jgi:hypothetical protein